MRKDTYEGPPETVWRKKLNIGVGRKNICERGRKGRLRKKNRAIRFGSFAHAKLKREEKVKARRLAKLLSRGRIKRFA